MNNETSITARMSAFGRAYHTEHTKNTIFADTKARELMTDEEYGMIAAYILGGMDFFAPDKKDSFANKEQMLSEHGFLVYELMNCNEIQQRYFSERTDWLSAFEHMNYAHAVLKK